MLSPETNVLRAYHGDPALKDAVLAEMAEHRRQDHLVQDYGYWEDGKGCAVGCLIKSGDHAQYESRFGIPEELAHLEDKIFEGLPREQGKLWPERFLGAIPVGADLSRVRWRFLHWLLTDPSVNPGIEHEIVKDVVRGVADLCMSAALGEMPSEDRWSAARSAAWSAAESAAKSAWSAAESAWSAAKSAWSAAESAWSAAWSAWSAAESAWSAAWSARSAAESAESAESAAESAWSAARSAAWERMAEALLRFIAEAGVPAPVVAS